MNKDTDSKNTVVSFSSILDNNQKNVSQIQQMSEIKFSPVQRNLVVGGVVITSMGLAAGFLTAALTGLAALVATGALAVVGVAGFVATRKFSPLYMQKLNNLKMKKMMEEARKNAIHQLENQVLINDNKLKGSKEALKKMGSLVMRLESEYNEDKDNEKKKAIFNTVKVAHEKKQEALIIAGQAYKSFEKKVQEFKDMDKFTKIANEAMAYSNSGDDKLNEMLSLESFRHIEDEFNAAIVSIETESMMEGV